MDVPLLISQTFIFIFLPNQNFKIKSHFRLYCFSSSFGLSHPYKKQRLQVTSQSFTIPSAVPSGNNNIQHVGIFKKTYPLKKKKIGSEH